MRSPSENFQCVVPENIHTLPREGIGIFREGGVSKAQKCKAMYEGKLEFLEEWQIASVGGGGGEGMDTLWKYTITFHWVDMHIFWNHM